MAAFATSAESKQPISGPFIDDITTWDYRSKKAGDMEKFLNLIHGVKDIKTKVLQFGWPQDRLEESGILRYLKIDTTHPHDDYEVPLVASQTPLIDEPRASAKRLLQNSLLLARTPKNVPLRELLAVYVTVFKVCQKVETIEVPKEWAGEFDWPEGMFPQVDRGIKVVLEDGRVRWGPEIKYEGDEFEDDIQGADDGNKFDHDKAAWKGERSTFIG